MVGEIARGRLGPAESLVSNSHVPALAPTPTRKLDTHMRRFSVLALLTLVSGVFVVVAANPAFAVTSITTPNQNPFQVPGGTSPTAFDVAATGYSAGATVFIEQCDGKSPSASDWDVTKDCDLGTSPAPVTADGSGNVFFDHTVLNHAFTPAYGESPQSQFNCLAPSDSPLSNGLINWFECQIRVSTNNSSATGDQAFLTILFGPPRQPDAPINVSAAPAIGQATVQWSQFFDGGSPVK